MAVNNLRRNVGYGLSDALLNVFPAPIIAQRDPTTSDFAQLGTIWVNKSSGAYWVLTQLSANSASWDNSSGGAGSFTSVTATTGNITASVGNIVATAGTVTGGTGLVATTGGLTVSAGGASITGVTTIASGTSAINISADAAATTVNIGTGAGAKTVKLGSLTTTSTTTIQSGTGGIFLDGGGIVTVGAISATVASPTATAVVNVPVGQAVFTGFTTAAAASQTFTITNSSASAASVILVSVSTLGSNDAQLTVTRVKPGSGTFDVTVVNNGAAAVNGDVHVNFWVID